MKKYNSEENPELEVVADASESASSVEVEANVNINFSGGEYIRRGTKMKVSEKEFKDRYALLVAKGLLKKV